MIEIHDPLFYEACNLQEKLIEKGVDFDIPARVVFPDPEFNEYPEAIDFLKTYILKSVLLLLEYD